MLRDYQRTATVAMINDLNIPGNSILCLPTASGKSHIIAAFVKYIKKPILILAPSKELLEQDREKLLRLVDKSDVGTYSASAGEKTIRLYTFATIGSIFRKPELFSHFSCVIVDECQNVRSDKPDSMYMKLFRRAGLTKIYGISATPFLNVSELQFLGMENGQIVFESSSTLQLMTRMDDGFWDRIIYNITPKEIEALGYTVPVKYMGSPLLPEEQLKLKKDGSDFDEDYFAYKTKIHTQTLVDNIRYCQDNYHSTLVFCSNIIQATTLSAEVDGSAVVTSKTPKKEREAAVEGFKSGRIKVVFNVSCLTVGFDHPSLDCLIIIRPTKSLGLWQQFIGRGVRISPETNKTRCDVIDFAGNYQRLGDASDIHLEEQDGVWDIISKGQKWHGRQIASITLRK